MGIGREACIKLAKRAPDGLGRYGDAMQPRPYGIETVGTATLEQGQPSRTWLVESVRHVWSIERPKVRRFDWRSQFAETAQPASPRTSVNNCTVTAPPFIAELRLSSQPHMHREHAHLCSPRCAVEMYDSGQPAKSSDIRRELDHGSPLMGIAMPSFE